MYQPTKLYLDILFDNKIKFYEGDSICVKSDENNIFFGYIFTKKIIDNDIVSIISYDQIRYLIARDTYIYKNKTASQVLKMICADFNIKTGSIEDTNYIIPYRIEENQTILDIIYTSLDLTKSFNGNQYVIFDDFGKVALKSYNSMKLPILIDFNNSVISYSHITSIDKNVYNSVKVSVKNKKTKVISTYLEEDNENKKKWGTLRIFKRLPNDFNSVQAKNYAQNILSIYNKLSEKIEVICFGNEKVRAGNLIDIIIENNTKTMIIEECTHTIQNNEHIMKLLLSNV